MTSNQPFAGAKCLGCHKVIDASWSFCPICGADNRDPALHRSSVGNHSHDFQLGPHCVLCGVAASGQQPIQPQNAPSPLGSGSGSIVISDNLGLRLFGVAFIAITLLFSGFVAHFWASPHKGPANPPMVPTILFLSVFAIVGVGALISERATIFDVPTRTITLRRGVTFAPKVETYGFDSVKSLRLDRSNFSGQGSSFNQPCTLYLVTGKTFNTLVKSYSYMGQARAACEDLSRRTGIPLDDRTQSFSGM